MRLGISPDPGTDRKKHVCVKFPITGLHVYVSQRNVSDVANRAAAFCLNEAVDERGSRGATLPGIDSFAVQAYPLGGGSGKNFPLPLAAM